MPDRIAKTLQVAVEHQQAGRLGEAENLYRQVLKSLPNHPDALHLLGMVCGATGREEIGINLIRQAIIICPAAEFYYNLGITLIRVERLEEAIVALHQAVKLKSSLLQAHFSIGSAELRLGRLENGIVAFEKVLQIKPDWLDALRMLAGAYRNVGNHEKATATYRHAIALDPGWIEGHYQLGVLQQHRSVDDAIIAFRQVNMLAPAFVPAYNSLSICLMRKGLSDEAMSVCRRGIALCTDLTDFDRNLSDLHITLSNAMKDQGQLDESLASLSRVLELRPDAHFVHSNIVFIICHHAVADSSRLLDAAHMWADRHARPLLPHVTAHRNDPSPDRKLKIGYVSADFTGHPVGRFMLPAISRHDREMFEVHCFSNVTAPDGATDWFRNVADRWHDIQQISDDACAELIRREGIDILVDLSLHTTGNRLLVFARKPAPVQVTYLAYCGTSGMDTIDYVITDPYLLPAGADESCFTEKPVLLKKSYWSFRPWNGVPDPGPLPALTAGHVTFGSLNNFSKVTQPALDAWREIMLAVPKSRLILHAKQGSHRERVFDFFAEVGIDSSRIEFFGHSPAPRYYAEYQRIDLILDPFPFAGGTTTCDALWMGVPVISLAGNTPVSRGGLSILSNIGLPELVAFSTEQYIQLAIKWANDLPQLAQLRATLRDRMKSSPLMDEIGFVADLEAIYRTIWRRWCKTVTGSGHV